MTQKVKGCYEHALKGNGGTEIYIRVINMINEGG